MSKLSLASIANLQNENTAVTTLNSNSNRMVTALENTLSRDGTLPNNMSSQLDMNNNQIINLPAPVSGTSPVRRIELDNATDLASSIDLTGRTLVGLPSLLWNVTGLECGNGTPHLTTVNMAAQSIVFYNPDTRASLYLAPGDVPAGMTCSISTTGAGGRDTGSAYAIGEEVYFYFIAGTAVSTTTIVSRTAPLGVNGLSLRGPVLPAGYTVYAPAFPFVISDNANLCHDSHQADEGTRQTFNGSASGTQLFTSDEPSGPLTVGWKVYGPWPTGVSDVYIVNMVSHAGTGGEYTLSKNVGAMSSSTVTASNPFPTNFLVRDKKVWFHASILDNLTPYVGFSSAYAWNYTRWVPSTAKTIDLELNSEIRSELTPGSLTTAALVTAWGLSNDLNISTYGYDGNTQPYNLVAEFPVSSDRTMDFTYLQGGGVTLDQSTVNFLRGYTFG